MYEQAKEKLGDAAFDAKFEAEWQAGRVKNGIADAVNDVSTSIKDYTGRKITGSKWLGDADRAKDRARQADIDQKHNIDTHNSFNKVSDRRKDDYAFNWHTDRNREAKNEAKSDYKKAMGYYRNVSLKGRSEAKASEIKKKAEIGRRYLQDKLSKGKKKAYKKAKSIKRSITRS